MYINTKSGTLNKTSSIPTKSNNNISAVKLVTNSIKNSLTEKGTNYPYTNVKFKPLIILSESPPFVNTIKEATYYVLLQRRTLSIPL